MPDRTIAGVEAVNPMGVRNLRGSHRTPPSLHWEGLQQTNATFGAGISQPAAIWGSTCPADRSKAAW